MEEYFIEKLKKDFPEHTFKAIPVENEKRSFRLEVNGNLFKIKWTHEFDNDLEFYHHLNSMEELYKIIVKELNYELDLMKKVKL